MSRCGVASRLHPALAAYVEQIRVERSDAAQPYAVLPGPFPVMGFQIAGSLDVLRDGATQPLARSGVTGLQPAVRHFRSHPGTTSVLVVLKPWAGFLLLDTPMDQIADQHVPLDAIVPNGELRRLDEPCVESVQRFLLARRVRARRDMHPMVESAAREIMCSAGTIAVERVARRVSMSRRQLTRLFQSHVGVGPKEFASLVRFQRVVSAIRTRRSWADLALAAGYADQAHLVRDFTHRAGLSPARYAAAGV